MFDPDKPSRFMLKRETDSVGRTFQFTRGQTRENAPLASIPSSVQRAKYWVISEVVTLDTPTNDHKGYIAAVGKNVGDGPLYAVDANGYHYFSFAMKHQANEGEISQDEKILWRFKMKAIP
jgi:hypothetical protein